MFEALLVFLFSFFLTFTSLARRLLWSCPGLCINACTCTSPISTPRLVIHHHKKNRYTVVLGFLVPLALSPPISSSFNLLCGQSRCEVVFCQPLTTSISGASAKITNPPRQRRVWREQERPQTNDTVCVRVCAQSHWFTVPPSRDCSSSYSKTFYSTDECS